MNWRAARQNQTDILIQLSIHIFFLLCCRVSVPRGRLRWRTRSRVACQMMFCRPAQSQFSRTSRHCADDDDDDADADSVGIGTRPLALAAVRKYTLVDAGVYNRTYATHVSHITLSQCVRGVVCMCCNLRLCVADAVGDVRTNPKLDKSVDTVRLYLPRNSLRFAMRLPARRMLNVEQ